MAEKNVRLTITLWDEDGSGTDILDIAVNLEKLKKRIREFEHYHKKSLLKYQKICKEYQKIENPAQSAGPVSRGRKPSGEVIHPTPGPAGAKARCERR